MLTRALLALSTLLLSAQLLAAEPTTGPVIDGYGASFVINDSDVPLIDNHVYRVFWEVTGYNGSPDSVNRNLDRVARFLNLHAKNGVPAENMELAIVVHGAALVNALDDESYQTRFDMKNPNLDLVQKLADAGVQIYVCGQSMGFRDFAKSELSEPVKLATSAMTMVHQLQFEGYTMLP
jgi:intracellular sulfur oxidation DsrE/DsrF family protein